MTVYVDNVYIPFGRMKMCHMTADNLDELHEMAEALGIRRWFQDKGVPHYDVSMSIRAKAVALGAVEEDWRDTRAIERHREMRIRQRRRKAAQEKLERKRNRRGSA